MTIADEIAALPKRPHRENYASDHEYMQDYTHWVWREREMAERLLRDQVERCLPCHGSGTVMAYRATDTGLWLPGPCKYCNNARAYLAKREGET
jgi:hypothetical protein